jgi:hypothetical protein
MGKGLRRISQVHMLALRETNPRFQSELATTAGMTVGALTVALTTPHAGMPMFMLNDDQRQDVIAHILSLR